MPIHGNFAFGLMEGWPQSVVIRILSRIYDPEAGRGVAQVIDFSCIRARKTSRVHGTHGIIILNNLYIVAIYTWKTH